jgi:adenylosuccinate synthase
VSATVVTGTQWGDEGKGKVVDFLAASADVVVRYNGGANAGHTVYVGDSKFAFHLVPAGVARKRVSNVIAAGTALDPKVLVEEIENAKRQFGGVRLTISERAHVVLPYHKLLDELQEASRDEGAKIGTTKRGLGPAYQDKAGRSGLRVADLLDPRALEAHVERAAKAFAPMLPESRREEFSAGAVARDLQASADLLRPFVGDAEELLWRAHRRGKRILLEGAHGMMLDLDFGTYPFVTSSSCVAGGAAISGLPPSAITRSVGVVKAYTTRVGAGPFPTELGDEEGGLRLREAGGEYGTTTGRPRRCGWLDLVIVRRACRLSGITELALTKLDVLQGIEPLMVAVGYTLEGRKVDTVPARATDYARCKPRLRKMKSIPSTDWRKVARAGGRRSNLPREAQDYLRMVEQFCGVPVTIVGVGPRRDDVLIFKPTRPRTKAR